MDVKVTVLIGEPPAGEIIEVGQKALDAVLFDFNPSSKLDVAIVKVLFAAIIEKMQRIRDADGTTSAMLRQAAVAITQSEISQMCAVKAYFAK